MRFGTSAHQCPVSAHQHHQTPSDPVGEQRHRDCGDHSPYEERVPLPLPDFTKQAHRMVTQVLELTSIHRQPAGMKEMYTEFNERQKEEEMERRHRMRADLRSDLVEPKRPGEHDDQKGGDPDRRVDPDHDAKGQTPCETARCDAAAQLPQQRAQHSAAKELAEGLG